MTVEEQMLMNTLSKECERLHKELQRHKWIPVSERLPEKYTYTLWCASSGYVRSDYFNGEYWEGAKKFCYDVIAWMPLPEPYKESDVVCTYQESGCGSCKHQTDCPY